MFSEDRRLFSDRLIPDAAVGGGVNVPPMSPTAPAADAHVKSVCVQTYSRGVQVFRRPILLMSTPNTLDPLCMPTQAEDFACGRLGDLGGALHGHDGSMTDRIRPSEFRCSCA